MGLTFDVMLFIWLLGVLFFVVSPLLGRLGVRQFAHMMLWLAQFSIGRSAFVLGEHGDLYYKSMQFTDLGYEKIRMGDQDKLFEDPDRALHYFKNTPFALADEKHGLIFDPRHAAIGVKKAQAEERGELTARATDAEYKQYGVGDWVRGVFELDKAPSLVRLGDVRSLVAGIERAEWPARVAQYYKYSRRPKADRSGISRLLIPVVAFLGVLGGMWLIRDQMAGGAGGSTIGYGLLWLLVSLPAAGDGDAREDAMAVIKYAAAAVPALLFVGLLFVAFGPLGAVAGIIIFTLGFLALPAVVFVARASNRLSGLFASLFLRLGLMLGFDRPVFYWDKDAYRVREYADLDASGETYWYDIKGALVGFAFDVSEDAFDETVDRELLESSQPVTDGGSAETNIPTGYVPCELLDRGPYGGFIPRTLHADTLYVASGRAMARLAKGARGEKSTTKLEEAKEEFGVGGWDVSDATIAKYTFGAILLGSLLGTLLFFGGTVAALIGVIA